MDHFKFQHVNGKLIPDGQATISHNDMGLIRSFAVFDYFSLKQGVPIFLEDHIERFFNSARVVGLPVPVSKQQMRKDVLEFIKANQVQNGGIRFVLTGGVPDPSTSKPNPNFLIHGVFLPKFDPAAYFKGVSLITHHHQREFPEAKTTNYMMWRWLFPSIEAAGAIDVLYYFNSRIRETSRGNFFIVDKNNSLVTPENDVLKGITRKHILLLAKDHYKTQTRDLTIAELKTAKEAFILSSSKGVLPVIKVDDIIINKGKPGSVTKHLADLLNKHIETYITQSAAVV